MDWNSQKQKGDGEVEEESTWNNFGNGRAFGEQCGNLLQWKLSGI